MSFFTKQDAIGIQLQKILFLLIGGVAGAAVVLIAGLAVHLRHRPDLKVWHRVELDTEFTRNAGITSFDDYLAQEKKVFDQLARRIGAGGQTEATSAYDRFAPGSRSDPGSWPRNWNRTFVLTDPDPRAGVLLLHGMSDSPYSLHTIGERLHAAGATVIGLRLPGHGTAPSGLVNLRWQDMAAAVRLAAVYLGAEVGRRPLYLIGYSTGAALALNYALGAAADLALPRPQALVLMSPAVGVSPLAGLAVWQARIGRLPGLEKLAWNEIRPEYDPFKYQSFAINAGDQVYRLAVQVRQQLDGLKNRRPPVSFPRVLAFQSVADATVSTGAVVEALFEKLPGSGHELVLMDINRHREVNRLLADASIAGAYDALLTARHPYSLCLLTNRGPDSDAVVVRCRPPGQDRVTNQPLALRWPAGIYSLSHVALPFEFDDPLYGGAPTATGSLRLGASVLRGERGLLQIPAAEMLRLRWNPFFPYLMERLVRFVGLDDPANAP